MNAHEISEIMGEHIARVIAEHKVELKTMNGEPIEITDEHAEAIAKGMFDSLRDQFPADVQRIIQKNFKGFIELVKVAMRKANASKSDLDMELGIKPYPEVKNVFFGDYRIILPDLKNVEINFWDWMIKEKIANAKQIEAFTDYAIKHMRLKDIKTQNNKMQKMRRCVAMINMARPESIKKADIYWAYVNHPIYQLMRWGIRGLELNVDFKNANDFNDPILNPVSPNYDKIFTILVYKFGSRNLTPENPSTFNYHGIIATLEKLCNLPNKVWADPENYNYLSVLVYTLGIILSVEAEEGSYTLLMGELRSNGIPISPDMFTYVRENKRIVTEPLTHIDWETGDVKPNKIYDALGDIHGCNKEIADLIKNLELSDIENEISQVLLFVDRMTESANELSQYRIGVDAFIRDCKNFVNDSLRIINGEGEKLKLKEVLDAEVLETVNAALNGLREELSTTFDEAVFAGIRPNKAITEVMPGVFVEKLDQHLINLEELTGKIQDAAKNAKFADMRDYYDAMEAEAQQLGITLADSIEAVTEGIKIACDLAVEAKEKAKPDPAVKARIEELETKLAEAEATIKANNDEKEKQSIVVERLQAKLEKVQQQAPQVTVNKAVVDATKTSLIRRLLYVPLTTREVMSLISDLFPHVVFADNMDTLIDECAFKNHKRLLKELLTLCEDYYGQIMSGKPDTVAKNVFSPNVYKQWESDTVMTSAKLRAKREFPFGGKRKLMGKHLTIGTTHDKAKTVQIYFEVDSTRKVLEIGYVGEHLPLA